MDSNFKIRAYKDGTLVSLGSPYGRLRILEGFYALSFFGGACMFILELIRFRNESIPASVFAVIAMIACFICFYRFVNRGSEIEKLFINKERLDIIDSSLFTSNKHSYLLSEISDFKFLNYERMEPHPLKVDTFDYLGFQTQQQVIQELHGEGRISFFYQGRCVRFGKELASWEFEELEVLIFDLTGNDLRYTDNYEKANFAQNND